MKAQEFLLQIEKLDTMIRCKLDEAQMWRDAALSITGQMGGERVQTSGNPQKMADSINRYLDIDDELPEDIKRLRTARREIIAVIEQLKPKQYEFIHMVYVQHLPLDVVAQIKNRSYSWATSIHGNCLKQVQRILDAKVQ